MESWAASDEVRKNAGAQFDPIVCDAFIRIHQRGELENIAK